MGRFQLVVLSQPGSEDVSALEDAMARCLEVAPIQFVDGLVMTKNANDEFGFVAVCDLGDPDRAWRGLIAQALFGRETVRYEPWRISNHPDDPGDAIDLTEEQLWEISDRIPRLSSTLVVLVEHQWMDELTDVLIEPGRLIANGWISIGKLIEMGNAPPQREVF